MERIKCEILTMYNSLAEAEESAELYYNRDKEYQTTHSSHFRVYVVDMRLINGWEGKNAFHIIIETRSV